MSNEIQPGMRVLMPGGVFPGSYVVVEIEQIQGDTIIGKEVAPGNGTREVQAERRLVITGDFFPHQSQNGGSAFSQGRMTLQQITGGFQIVTPIHDVRTSDQNTLVRLWTSIGGTLTGGTSTAPISDLMDPATLLSP